MSMSELEAMTVKDARIVARCTFTRSAEEVEKLRIGYLLDEDGIEGAMTPAAEQHYLLALNALEMAERYLKLAALEQDR